MENGNKELIMKRVKLFVVIIIVLLFIWFLVGYPFLTLMKNEAKAKSAAKRYFEINSIELPTGTRTRTIDLQTLYKRGILTEDLKGAYSKNVCSVSNSWVKVKRVNNDYKYYVYLDCGVLSSFVDHKGPAIVLNGEDEITLNKGDKYQELGVKSVTDNTDGKLNIKNVKVDNKSVNTNKVGTYTVTYSISDSFLNETLKTRTVKVVSRVKNVVKTATNNMGIYTGLKPNNYIYFSGMLFRIIGIDGDNVKIVSNQDISYINYEGIDKWLDYYYEHLTAASKKLIVENKYCNMNLDDNSVSTVTECNLKTDKKKVYLLSADDINKSLVNSESYLQSDIISWTANKKSDTEAYSVRRYFFGTKAKYLNYDIKNNLGIRPVITIKGDILVKNGDGSLDKPYSLGDFTYAKAEDKVNSRYSGEYLKYAGSIWQIVGTENDGTTKVIGDFSLSQNGTNIVTNYNTTDKAKIYNPKQKGNVGYFINNKTSSYIKDDYFVTKNINVPIYKNDILYGKEKESKQYKVKFSAPNLYELFSASNGSYSMRSYWAINSSQRQYTKAVVADVGSLYDVNVYDSSEFGIRPVGYLEKAIEIVSGNGTKDKPYVISK